ncbi:hypothetical protein IGI04_003261 [Brassica rapa subsp. trilocularis]|uniref:Uncharacterized protein n=1 Tax=Brassica rapa subsp. trilocularis TaxID=1813537 RepID=A0ABQ7P1A6_BRACM|nr:hypothetical protein IGI04_003261 [Brassica rapa subsp. trilocularis]
MVSYRASWRVHKEYSEYGKRFENFVIRSPATDMFDYDGSQEYEKGKRLCMIESGVLRSKYLVHQASLGKKQTHLRTRILSNLEGALYKFYLRLATLQTSIKTPEAWLLLVSTPNVQFIQLYVDSFKSCMLTWSASL